MLVDGVLIDVSRHFPKQSEAVAALDGVLLTHAHRDASGGIAALRRWWVARRAGSLPVFAPPQAVEILHARYRRWDGLELIGVEPGERVRVGSMDVVGADVPHAREARFRTYAWRLSDSARTVVYASDVGRLEPALRRFSQNADVLVIDGAMWERSLFAHLTIDRELPELCGWRARRILLTQIGRTAPAHEALERAVGRLCLRAAPAWDGLTLDI